jgi:hypothetical protein
VYPRQEHATPAVKRQPYEGQFTNCHGERWLYTYSYETNEAIITGDDVDWKKIRVVHGRAQDLHLHRAEQMWLMACWLASTEFLPV